MSGSIPAIDLSNYPESIDINLHPPQPSPSTPDALPGMVHVSKIEFDRLCDINQTTVSENERLREEIDQLQANNRDLLVGFKAERHELKKQIDELTNRHSQHVITSGQTVAHLQCQIKKLESERSTDEIALFDNQDVHYLESEIDSNNLENAFTEFETYAGLVDEEYKTANTKLELLLKQFNELKKAYHRMNGKNQLAHNEAMLKDKLCKVITKSTTQHTTTIIYSHLCKYVITEHFLCFLFCIKYF